MPERDTKTKDESKRPVARDPRLEHAAMPQNPLMLYGKLAGWVGFALLLLALFWYGIAQVFTWPIRIIGILAILAIGFWLVSHIQQLVQSIKTRGFSVAMNSALFSLFVLGSLVLVNYIGGRHHIFRHDFTQDKFHSLSDVTLNVLGDLDQPVSINAFISDEYYDAMRLRDRLREYDFKSPRLSVTIYDYKTAREKVDEFGVRFDGTLIIEAGEDAEKKREEIQGGTEEQITSAILAVTTGEKTKIYFLTGHGEMGLELDSPEGRSLSTLRSVLENQQYDCDTLSLATMQEPKVPADCRLLVIAGARNQPMPEEMEAIRKYLEQGGNLYLMLEPSPAPNFADLLRSYGVTPLGGMVLDEGASVRGRPEFVATMPEAHEITAGLERSYLVLPTTTGFELEMPEPPPAMPGGPPPPPKKGEPLLQSSQFSTLQNDPERRGPFVLAAAVDESSAAPPTDPYGMPLEDESGERKSRIVVVGDADFATDQYIQPGGWNMQQNLYFAAMSVNWLVKNEKLIAVPPKEPAEKPLHMTTAQTRFVWVLTIGITPLLVIIAGVAVWWFRRRI